MRATFDAFAAAEGPPKSLTACLNVMPKIIPTARNCQLLTICQVLTYPCRMPTLIRETVYALYHVGRFVAAYMTREQAETVARGMRGTIQIVAMTGKREEQS